MIVESSPSYGEPCKNHRDAFAAGKAAAEEFAAQDFFKYFGKNFSRIVEGFLFLFPSRHGIERQQSGSFDEKSRGVGGYGDRIGDRTEAT
jgi:hypothetical protein